MNSQATTADQSAPAEGDRAGNLPGLLSGVRVIEIADEQAEYVGLLMAGMGATVVKVEPPEGSSSRRLAPFYGDEEAPERSLFFWAYNRGKRSIALDTTTPEGRARLEELIADADVVLESGPDSDLASHGLDSGRLRAEHPGLIVARMTPFGDDGPWSGYRASDLVHLALGGVTMNCGYDPDPAGRYDLPPIAPQVWHAYHIAGEELMMGVYAALISRQRTGRGQQVSIAVHEAVAKNTELDVTNWVMSRTPFQRQTCRHAAYGVSRVPSIAMTKDGRWIIAKWNEDERTYKLLADFFGRYGMAFDLHDLPPDEQVGPKIGRAIPGASWNGSPDMTEQQNHRLEVFERFVRAHTYADFPWMEGQKAGLMMAPLRLPHENADDPHWRARETYSEVEHPELDRSFTYPTSKWLSTATSWKPGRRAPLLDEDADAELPPRLLPPQPRADDGSTELSARGKPFALEGVRILDFSWFLASAGGTRFVTTFGAESLKVEWKGAPDTRFGSQAPVGGRAARDAATEPLEQIPDQELGGQFNFKNPGKRGISLNLADPRGVDLAKRLVAISDVVAEGFRPGVMERRGLGYDVLREIKPDIIYAQQSGAGQVGTYEAFRATGPIANAITGLCEQSGLPEPAMPAGWGYSYLDWIGAYNFAVAILGAIFHRDRTGEGQWIDASQAESGLYLNALPVLDYSANGRAWSRTGNRSPYIPAAPHGIYRCVGEDRWIAIACTDEEHWTALAQVAGLQEAARDPRFATLEARVKHQDALDAVVSGWTETQEPFAAMKALQAAGVPAGVCQNAEDRVDHDPQLAHLEWLVEIEGTRIGRWPVPENPVRLSETPAYVGGRIDRGAPLYGEDNEYVFGELLGLSTREISQLAEEDVI